MERLKHPHIEHRSHERPRRSIQRIGDAHRIVQSSRQDNGVIDVELSVGDDRSQFVSLAFVEDGDEEVVMLLSWVGDANEAAYEQLLRYNAELRYGRAAILDVDDVPKFCVMDHALLEELTSEELLHAVCEIGEAADNLEKMLFEGDVE